MAKQTKNFAHSIKREVVCIIAGMVLFFSCKKKEMPQETPQITISAHRVTFDSKNGTAVNAAMVKAGDTLILPKNPTKAGFIFSGWYTDSLASAVPFSTSTVITADLTLFAKWTVFSLSSASFADGGEIPSRFGKCDDFSHFPHLSQADRLNISPQLSWTNAPQGTTSFLIIMQRNIIEDVIDVGNNINWIVYNLPAGKTSLAENDPSIQEIPFRYSYKGPSGTEGETYTHKIIIFALNLPENYFNGDDVDDDEEQDNQLPSCIEEAEQKLKGHILASASITGTYTPKYYYPQKHTK